MYQDTKMKKTLGMSRVGWLCAIMVLGLAGMGFAAESAAPAAAPEPSEIAPSAAASGEEALDPNQPEVDFSNGCLIKFIAFQKDSNIRDGLRLLAALCKKNIVPSSRVDGPLTVSRLYNVTFEQALDAILGYGFRYEQDGDFVRVYTAEEYKRIKEDPARMIGKMIPIYYVRAEEVLKLITPVLSTEAKVQTSEAAENTLSAGGSSGGTGGGLSASGGGDDLAGHDMIVIFDYPENIEKAEKLIREVDLKPKQVLIEATIMAARLNEDTRFGIDWNLLGGFAVDMVPAFLPGEGTPIQQTGFAAPPGSPGLTAGVSSDNLQAIVTALETITDTTLLANPKILAVNKQEGAVLIGRKIGYINATTQTQTSTTQSVDFLETGTRLAFRPYIGNDGYIRMDIYPKDSDGVLKQNDIPDETTTELRTNVIVKDGETVVIGGLFRDNIITSREQIPLLGNLPLIGVLFRGTTDTVQREEVIILLTPHIIGEPAETRAEERLDDIRVKREAAKDSLQGFDRAKWAEDAYTRAARYYLEGDLAASMYNLKVALMMRPTYLEALRLRERIIAETDPEQFKRLDSIVVEDVDELEAKDWSRH